MKTSIINHQISVSFCRGDITVSLGCRPAINCGTQEMVKVGRELIGIARQVLGDPPDCVDGLSEKIEYAEEAKQARALLGLPYPPPPANQEDSERTHPPSCRACAHSFMEPDSELTCGLPEHGPFGQEIRRDGEPCGSWVKFVQHPRRKQDGSL